MLTGTKKRKKMGFNFHFLSIPALISMSHPILPYGVSFQEELRQYIDNI